MGRLFDRFETQLATSGPDGGQIEVVYGPVRNYDRESVGIGDVTSPAEQVWALLGNSSREERYAINTTIVAGDPRHQTPRAQIDRAFVILGVLETWLRANVDLGLSGSFTHIRTQVASVNVQQFPDPDADGPVVQTDFTVGVVTRI